MSALGQALGQLPTHDETAFSDVQPQPEAERQVPSVRLSSLPDAEPTSVTSACGVLVRQFYSLASGAGESARARPPQPPPLVLRKRRADWAREADQKRVR